MRLTSETKRDARTRLRQLLMGVALGASGPIACDAEPEEDTTPRACVDAVDEVRSCFGDEVAQTVFEGCDVATAERLLGLPCEQLAVVMLDNKADDPVAEAVREAVQEALHQAIVVGLNAALQQIGLPTEGYAAYVMLDEADSEADATALAREWEETLQGRSGFAPTVRAYDSGWAVVHAPCVVELNELLPQFVADLVLGDSDTIAALGGTFDTEGETSKVSLPLRLLPQAEDDVTDPACG